MFLCIEQNPLKAKVVKKLEVYPYSSYNYFLDAENIPECLEQSWIVQRYDGDVEAIKAFLNSDVDTSQLSEMKKASSLVEATNVEKKPDEKKLKKQLSKAKDTKERNVLILTAYIQGYSQHMIAKVLKLNQATVHRIIKRTKI